MKSIAVELDKVRNLRFGFNAMCDFEEITGQQLGEDVDLSGFRNLRALVWTGLKWEDKSLTLSQTGNLIENVLEEKGADYLMEKVQKAMAASRAKEESKVGLEQITK